MPKEERGVIQASMMSRLGYQKPSGAIGEDFSTRTFLTNWNNLADSSKDALFGKGSEARQSLDKIVNVFRNVNNADAYANPSRTGHMIGTMMAFAPFFPSGMMVMGGDMLSYSGAALTASAGFIPPYYAAKLMTSPKWINWAADAGPKIAQNPNSVKFHLGRLMEIFSGDETMAEASMSYINALVPSIVGEAEAANMTKGILQEPESPAEIIKFAKDIKPEVAEKIKNIALPKINPVPTNVM